MRERERESACYRGKEWDRGGERVREREGGTERRWREGKRERVICREREREREREG
jgi:hypothetical protein